MIDPQKGFRSGYVSLIGRPNTGKSTLLNVIVGRKVSIVTPKPQTTRNRILGVFHGVSSQIVFLDTPGIHKSNKRLNQRMVKTALLAISESDIILLMIDAKDTPSLDKELYRYLRSANMPVFLLINKIDIIKKPDILKLIDEYKDFFPFKEIIPISALTGENLPDLIKTIIDYLKEGPPYFPDDMITDQTDTFAVAELIRERLILLTQEEIPYVCAVVVEEISADMKHDTIYISATIIVEKASQKGIIIGKGGKKLKEIGVKARRDIETLLGKRVFIDLWVKVAMNWRNKEAVLNRIGC